MAVNFRLAHVGINCDNEEEAKKIADLLCLVFNLDIRETPKAFFAGDYYEVMKDIGAGRFGHIAMEVDDIHEAIKELESKGFKCDIDGGMRRADGSLRLVYIKEDFAGFAIHITEKDKKPQLIYK
ncbi:MAG: hypothetical protein IJM08_00805 [Firmicutes bacterium]|jgi:2-dehydro-3-deoxyphosphogluconate aldolase/(4S)-4-hydroxy-2-oxoglutarate aldolase|nr:hypothetical protein [Bacillota bacterium]